MEGYLTLRRTFRRLNAPRGPAIDAFRAEVRAEIDSRPGEAINGKRAIMKSREFRTTPMPSRRWPPQLKGRGG